MTADHGLLGPIELTSDADVEVDELAVWDDAVAGLRAGLRAEDFEADGPPALLLASLPEPLFAAWAAWRGADVAAGTDGRPGFDVDADLRVTAQSDLDRQFLGPWHLYLMAGTRDGAWHSRGITRPVTEVVRDEVRRRVRTVAA